MVPIVISMAVVEAALHCRLLHRGYRDVMNLLLGHRR